MDSLFRQNSSPKNRGFCSRISSFQLAVAYKVFRCWVSEYQALPDLDANCSDVLIQHIKLENEGWERDYEIPEPTELSFTEPA